MRKHGNEVSENFSMVIVFQVGVDFVWRIEANEQCQTFDLRVLCNQALTNIKTI